MADQTRYSDFDDAGAGPDRRRSDGARRWLKLVGIVAVVLVLLFVVLQLTGVGGGGGGHGPAQHASSGDAGSQALLSNVALDVHIIRE